MYKQHDPTEGETFIEYFLEDEGIRYKREHEIHGLQSDVKRFRRADFYLPQYKVYVEFLGMQNTPEGRKEYQKKKEAYEKNSIPCVYIYPENLGVLGFMFRRRLEEELGKYPNRKWQLFKFKFSRLRKFLEVEIIFLFGIVLLLAIIENMMNGQLTIGTFTIYGTLFTLVLVIASILYSVKLIFPSKK